MKKMIIAVIQPEKLGAIQAALNNCDVDMMTVSEVLDCRRQGPVEIYRGREFRRPLTQLRLEIAVDEFQLDPALEAVRRAWDGDGSDKVFVTDLEDHAPTTSQNPLKQSSWLGRFGLAPVGHS